MLEQFGSRLGFPDMFERVFGVHEYAPGVPFVAAAHTVVATRVPHYRLDAYALRVDRRADDDLLRRLRPERRARGRGARRRPLPLRGDAAPRRARRRAARPSRLDEALAAFEASGAKRLLVTHRPAELPSDGEIEYAYDGLELTI